MDLNPKDARALLGCARELASATGEDPVALLAHHAGRYPLDPAADLALLRGLEDLAGCRWVVHSPRLGCYLGEKFGAAQWSATSRDWRVPPALAVGREKAQSLAADLTRREGHPCRAVAVYPDLGEGYATSDACAASGLQWVPLAGP